MTLFVALTNFAITSHERSVANVLFEERTIVSDEFTFAAE